MHILLYIRYLKLYIYIYNYTFVRVTMPYTPTSFRLPSPLASSRSSVITDMSRSKHSSVSEGKDMSLELDWSGKRWRVTWNLVRNAKALRSTCSKRCCLTMMPERPVILGHSYEFAMHKTGWRFMRPMWEGWPMTLPTKKKWRKKPTSADRDVSGDPDLFGWSWLDWRQILWLAVPNGHSIKSCLIPTAGSPSDLLCGPRVWMSFECQLISTRDFMIFHDCSCHHGFSTLKWGNPQVNGKIFHDLNENPKSISFGNPHFHPSFIGNPQVNDISSPQWSCVRHSLVERQVTSQPASSPALRPAQRASAAAALAVSKRWAGYHGGWKLVRDVRVP